MLGLTGFLGLTRISFFLLTQISQIPRYCFVGGKSHRCFCVSWLARIPLCFWAHTDLTDPTVLLCGWEISQMLLCVWTGVGSDGGTLLSLSRIYFSDPSDKSDLSDLSDKSDGLGILKKIIREICGICVRPPWDWDLWEASVGSVGL